MARLLVACVVGASMFQLVLRGWAQSVWYGGITWSPTGDYIAFLSVAMSSPSREIFSLFVPEVDREAFLTVMDRRGGTMSRMRIPTSAGYGWTTRSELVIGYSGGSGDEETRGWRVFTVHGQQRGQILPIREVSRVGVWSLSPDGRYLAYVGVRPGGSLDDLLVIQRLDDRRIIMRLPIDAYVDQLAWDTDPLRIAAVGGEFIWLCSIADEQAVTTRKIRRAQYYSGKIALRGMIAVNFSYKGLGLIPVGQPQRTRHLAIGSVLKGSFAPGSKELFALLMPADAGDATTTLLSVGRLSLPMGLHHLRQVARGPIADFCWSPDGKEIAYLTDTGRVEMLPIR